MNSVSRPVATPPCGPMPHGGEAATVIPSGLCQCGCGRETTRSKWACARKGLKAGDHYQFIRGHCPRDRHYRPKPRAERWSVDPDTGCWNWNLAVFGSGYGMDTVNRRPVRAHKRQWELRFGRVPRGMVLDHLCRNRRCVNPDHLEPVSNAENNRRGDATRLTWDDAVAIRRMCATGSIPRKSIAAAFGVCRQTVSDIALLRRWRPDTVLQQDQARLS